MQREKSAASLYLFVLCVGKDFLRQDSCMLHGKKL